jgi:predicted DNA-binding transcriptional regulator AlpA
MEMPVPIVCLNLPRRPRCAVVGGFLRNSAEYGQAKATKEPNDMAERQYIPMAELKDIYGISRSSAYRAINAGKLSIRKFGRTTLLKVSELEALIESGKQAT